MLTAARRCSTLVVAAALAMTSVAGPATADPATGQSTGGAHADAARRARSLRDDIAAATEERVRVERTLAALQRELAATADRIVAATAEEQRAATRAVEAGRLASAAQERLAAARRDLAVIREQLDAAVRETYKYGAATVDPVLAAFENVAAADTASELATMLHHLEAIMDRRSEVWRDTAELVDRVAELAQTAVAREQERRREVAAARASRREAARLHAEVQQLAARTETQLVRQRELVEALRSEHAEVTSRLRAARQAPSTAAGMVEVGGITVAAALAPELAQLLDHARSDGIVLGGSGWRSPEAQARLRRANGCPSPSAPASSCRVPTAPPGQSQHEAGLAVDFTWRGETICYPQPARACQGNAAYDWLAANAADHGLRVLASEAWHWSTTGR